MLSAFPAVTCADESSVLARFSFLYLRAGKVIDMPINIFFRPNYWRGAARDFRMILEE